MSAYIVVNVLGIFAIDDKSNIIEQYLFGNDTNKIASKLKALQDGELIDEFSIICNKLNSYEEIIIENKLLARELKETYPHQITIKSPHEIGNRIRKLNRPFLSQVKKTEEEFKQISKKVATIITRIRIKETAEGQSGKDKLVIQAIESLDILDKSNNLFIERLREWYGLHFPELDKKIQNHETYVKLAQFKREEMTLKNLQKVFAMSESRLENLVTISQKSMGSDMSINDFQPVKSLGNMIQELFTYRKELVIYIDQIVSEIAPNMRSLISANIIARLISHVGGLNELAVKPSSTIQILGAEKALFRSLKTGANPPKHGVIFQDDRINSAKWWLRGKVARLLAAKLTIAARLDAYGGKFLGDGLKEELEKQIKKLEEKFKEPPKKKKSPPKKLDKKKKKRRNRKKREKRKENVKKS
ncbi:MAG: C/D box methylation guide ribonucleoprotein complex aNOP56 subunit [Candidatus Helarchaeota archaeon]